jgi:hypothetical protein
VLQIPQSRASHESALHLHGVDRAPFAIAVTVPPPSRSSGAGVRVHRHEIPREHRATVVGIPTTSLPRAIVDVTSSVGPGTLAHIVDRATITQRATTVAAIGRALRLSSRRGRRNIAHLQRILDQRRPGAPAPRSRVERRVDDGLASTGLPRPLAEYPVPSLAPGLGFVDRAWPDARLILEIDGRTWHARERDMAKDRARDRAAARVGWLTLRVLDEEVRDLLDAVLDDVVSVYHQRRREIGPAS